MTDLGWTTAWRHLRVTRPPTWLPGLTLRAVYLALVGVGFLVHAAMHAPPELYEPLFTPPSPDWFGVFGALSLGLGVLMLALCGLARVFNLLATIIIFSVAQGTMALVVVLGLMTGLEDDLRARLLDHKAHVRVAREDGAAFLSDEQLLARITARPEVAGASPVLEGEVLVRTAFGRQGASLFGVDPSRHASVTALPGELEQGSYEFLSNPDAVPRPLPLPTLRDLPEPPPPDLPADPEPAAPAPADDADDGGWEDPSLEIPRMRDAGQLPPATAPAVPEDMSPEPEADDDSGWEDPEVEIPRMRAAGQLPPPVTPALPAGVEPGTPVAPDEQPEATSTDPTADAVLPPVLLGRELAADLGVGVGDPLQLITPVGRITPQGMVPGLLVARVAGVFFTGIYDYDSRHLYLPLPVAQAFQRAELQISAIEVRLHDLDAIDAGKAAIEEAADGSGLVVLDWRDLNRDLFAAMFLEKVAMFIALVFVILVAAFGILATNLMGVLERAPEIAILKAMGCPDRVIARIFALEGLCVGLLGSFGGIAVGVALGLAFGSHGIPVSGGVFYLERLPIRIEPLEVALVAGLGLVIVAVSSVWPARAAARLRPVDGLRLRDE